MASLPRPGGNVTGFIAWRARCQASGWSYSRRLRGINRVAFLLTVNATYAGYLLNPFKASAASFALEAVAAPVRDTSEVETIVAALAREPNGGLMAMPAFLNVHRAEIISLAAQHRLPTVYPFRFFTGSAACCPTEMVSATITTRGDLCRSHSQGREAQRASRPGSG